MTIIDARKICVERDRRRILNEVNFTLNAGELVGIVGPNGSGKSTLLRTLCGLQKMISGAVLVNGAALHTISQREFARLVGYLPQQAIFHWPISVRHAVAMGRFPYGVPAYGMRPDDTAAVDAAISAANLQEFINHGVDRLSGGERMRVHLARLLAGRHRVIIADEPITSIDVKFQLDFLTLLKQEAGNGVGIVISLHDLSLASRFCDRLVVLNHGTIIINDVPHAALSDEILAVVFGISAERFDTTEGTVLVPRSEPGKFASDKTGSRNLRAARRGGNDSR